MENIKKVFSFLITFSLIFSVVQAEEYTMTYLYGGMATTYINAVDRTGKNLNAVSPDYFDIDEKGNLYAPKIDKNFVNNMHDRNIKVIPFLSNHWDRNKGIAALSNIDKITEQIKNIVYLYNLDGVNVDIENVTHLYKTAYTNLVKTLRLKMPYKEITVAVAPNPYNWQTGWQGSYDYYNLAKYSDYLVIMGYDESYYGGPSGPVASARFIELSIQYALNFVPAKKLVLGIPFYGRFWQSGKNIGGLGITMTDIENILSNYPCTKTYYDDFQSVNVKFSLSESDIKPKLWGGKVLEAGSYDIWYDDINSSRFKLSLVKKYSLKGSGSWALGQETKEIWNMYSDYKNNLPQIITRTPEVVISSSKFYKDVKLHWAAKEIDIVSDNTYMKGFDDGNFYPENNLTRAEAVTIIMRMANLPETTLMSSFSDTKNHWAKDEIAKSRAYGIINGRGDNLFEPDKPIYREELVSIIDRVFLLLNNIDFNNNVFIDVYRGMWSYNSIIKLNQNDIIYGYKDNSFRPYNPITRAESACIFDRITGYGIRELEPSLLRTKILAEPIEEIIEPR